MVTLKTNMKMNNPNDFWTNIYDLGKVLAPWATVGVVCHQLINKVFRYFSDSRDAELREIVKVENEKIEKKWMEKASILEQKIDNLTRIVLEKNK